MLTREQIEKCNDVQIKLLSIPEWGGEVYIKSTDGLDRERIESEISKDRKSARTRAMICCCALCDENGNLLFEPTEENINMLSKKRASALDTVIIAAAELNEMTEEKLDEEKKKFLANPFRRFVFDLALALGKTKGELLSLCNSVELTQWMAYRELYGLPDAVFENALTCSTIANCHSTKGFSPYDFMAREKPKQSAKEMLSVLRSIGSK